MRGFTLRALPVCVAAFAVGCFSLSGNGNVGTPAAGTGKATPTHEYWQKANAALSQKPTNGEMKALVQLVQAQTDALRELAPDGVDPVLVAAVEDVVKCEEEVIRVAEMAGSDVTVLKTNQVMAQSFAAANQKAADAKKRLKALRGSLNDRYGGGFAPIGG
jgi:hypothetical protein